MGCLDQDLGNSMDVGRNERWNKITRSGVHRKLGQGLPGFFCDLHVCNMDEIVTHEILWKRVHIIIILQGSPSKGIQWFCFGEDGD